MGSAVLTPWPISDRASQMVTVPSVSTLTKALGASAAERRGYKPLARLVGYSHAGVEPKYMGIGPVPAVRRLLERKDFGSEGA